MSKDLFVELSLKRGNSVMYIMGGGCDYVHPWKFLILALKIIHKIGGHIQHHVELRSRTCKFCKIDYRISITD